MTIILSRIKLTGSHTSIPHAICNTGSARTLQVVDRSLCSSRCTTMIASIGSGLGLLTRLLASPLQLVAIAYIALIPAARAATTATTPATASSSSVHLIPPAILLVVSTSCLVSSDLQTCRQPKTNIVQWIQKEVVNTSTDRHSQAAEKDTVGNVPGRAIPACRRNGSGTGSACRQWHRDTQAGRTLTPDG
ncbi:hypothetical protein QWZ03_00635 [Chitinimonas viridis]|uniref:Uncharacterized protein n=1 Tax=Chitinimonas viridis TaxID=664880 RepID=A0ABT8B1B8_9NEIS|nr:hypothetical protein [Chitinimonas viridis]MDN3575279.1 hypothetical protein [Chitinimonas viridis]